MIFRDFREAYPELWCYGTNYVPYQQMTIMIINPVKGKFLYDGISKRITWLEHFKDKEEIKEEEKELRLDMYQNFLNEINYYQKMTGISQSEIARKAGISRKSINEYLKGVNPPKISTMRKIAEALGIDL